MMVKVVENRVSFTEISLSVDRSHQQTVEQPTNSAIDRALIQICSKGLTPNLFKGLLWNDQFKFIPGLSNVPLRCPR
jgi:hypothetical protein